MTVVFVLCFSGQRASAQELTPRSYAASPIGANVLVAGYAVSTGSVLTDPSLPVTNIQASLDRSILGYLRTFKLGKSTANIQAILPYNAASLRGDVMEQSAAAKKWGYGDASVRLGWNLIGDPALKPAEFARRKPGMTFGASLTVVAPTGAYNPSRLINVGSNRWAFLPEIGFEKPINKWFVDGSAGAWLYTSNENFLNGNVLCGCQSVACIMAAARPASTASPITMCSSTAGTVLISTRRSAGDSPRISSGRPG